MKEQPNRPKDCKDDIDLTIDSDDDFFDLPPFNPHTEATAKQKKTNAAKPLPRFSSLTAQQRAAAAKCLVTLVVALLLTVFVVLLAQVTRLPDQSPPQQDTPSTPEPPSSDADDPTQQPSYDTAYTYSADVTKYLGAIEYAPNRSDILLVNKTHPCGKSFVPAALVNLNTAHTYFGKPIQLDATAAAALEAMLLCMRADGITDTYVTSGYRTYQYQSMLFSLYIQREMEANPSLDQEQATAIVETYSSRPGQSEHQSGLCVDLITSTMSGLDESFEKTDAFAWLQENAAHFGFILRYPKGDDGITGYTYEPWHYRFVGKAAALEIAATGITLEEYLDATKP